MNKLIVSRSIDIENGIYYLDEDVKELNLQIHGIATLYLDNIKCQKMTVELLENSELTIYKFEQNKECDLEVTVNQTKNTTFNYNSSSINNANASLILNNNLLSNHNKSNINVRLVSNQNNSKIVINVDVKKNTFGNIALEDIKGLNNGGLVQIEPNIMCSTHDVMANHLNTIGGLNKNELDYLFSKGITKDKAKALLLKGFIYSNLDEYFQKKYGGD